MAETLDLKWTSDSLAKEISERWLKWSTARNTWYDEKKELREYLFATDTRKTTNAKLPWKNSTVTPKLTQLRDNLHANYMAALFPSEDWFIWYAEDKDSATGKKKQAIEAYMRTKLKASGFDLVVSQLVLDYIDYGNAFVGHEYVNLTKKDPATGEEVTVYRGPRAYRISPLDLVFDPTAPSFARTPVIVRTLKSLGDFQKDILTKPGLNYEPYVVQKVLELRTALNTDLVEQLKSDGMVVDGFGSLNEYFNQGMVEILEFFGDIYNPHTKEFLQDQIITVVDRRWILRSVANPSWFGIKPLFHCGWRLRPDNLWAQGPLDQLVGMQYRIDHLENLKADVFDQIAHPVIKVTGTTVEDFTFGPGVQIHCGDDGDVDVVRPDGTALNADLQIAELMNRMEELAGAPKQAAGIRTPGEKTKYEVQVLENGAGRIFQSKVNWFEKNIIEPVLNSMLEESCRNLGGTADSAKYVDPDLGVEEFIDITKTDIQARGKLYAIGARHFAEQARFVQDLSTTLTTVQNIPTVVPHISGKQVAKALEEALGWGRFKIVKDNIAIAEQLETQRLMQTGAETLETEAAAPAELQDQDFVPPEADEQLAA